MMSLLDVFREKIEVVVACATVNFELATTAAEREKDRLFYWGKAEGLANMAAAACPENIAEINCLHRSAVERINAAFEKA